MKLTRDEEVFLARMLPHYAAGLSVEDAARAVLADDERIFNEVFANNRTGVEAGVREALSAEIYAACRAKGK